MNKVLPIFLLAATVYIHNIPAASAAPQEHALLNGPFSKVSDVTAQCLTCHPQQGEDLLRSSHWTWKRQRMMNGSKTLFSKKNGLTTFAIAAGANPSQCLTCHISTNLLDERFDPTAAVNIDCLVCHDKTGTYERVKGAPKKDLNLVYIARNVGKPSSENCFSCHGTGTELAGQKIHNGIEKDIHLQTNGAGLTCQNCHPSGDRHAFTREITSAPGLRQTKACAVCHTDSPHHQQRLNDHAELINCMTCHIPQYATENPAIISWNWLAPQTPSIHQNLETDTSALVKKFGIIQAQYIQPVYFWDNGDDSIYTRGAKIDKYETTPLQKPSTRTAQSKIAPFTVSLGTQMIDGKYRYLIAPTLAHDGTLEMRNNSLNDAAQEGMQKLRLPFSGDADFTSTVTYRQLNHGVVPAEQALDCMDCHGKKGRIEWPTLGYAMDPWLDREAPTKIKVPQVQPEESAPITLPPIRETILPVEPQG